MASVLTSIATLVEKIANLGAGLASYGGMYQPQKPDCLIKQLHPDIRLHSLNQRLNRIENLLFTTQ